MRIIAWFELRRAVKAHNWKKAYSIAKLYGFDTEWIALARIVQLLNEVTK